MNATTQLTREQSSPPAVGLGRIVNNSVALILLDLLNKAIPLIVFPRVVRALGPAAYGQIGIRRRSRWLFWLAGLSGVFHVCAARSRQEQRTGFVPRQARSWGTGCVCNWRLCAARDLHLVPCATGRPDASFDNAFRSRVRGGSLDTQWIFAARSRMSMIAVQGALAQLAYAGLILALVRGSRDAWIIPSATVALPGSQHSADLAARTPSISHSAAGDFAANLGRFPADLPGHGIFQPHVHDLRPD